MEIIIIILALVVFGLIFLRIKDYRLSNQFNRDKITLESRFELSQLMNNIQNELRLNQEKTLNLSSIIIEHKKITEKLHSETNNLNKILSNNQLRGAYGQTIAENLLKQVGFVKGLDFAVQEQQVAGNRPDITFKLHNQTKINIDVKFPFQALHSYFNTEHDEQKKEHLSAFKKDVRARFKEIKTRDYINVWPSELYSGIKNGSTIF